MNLVGLMPCRNEDWVLGLSARVALMWCDSIIILAHASTDRTAQIAMLLQDEFGDRVALGTEDCPLWDEMTHRQHMLNWARANGGETRATHIAIIDADEILTGNLLSGIRERVAALSAGQMLQLPGYNLRGGLNRYHLNGVWGQRWFSTAFKDVNTAAWKGDKFHAREPEGVRWTGVRPVLPGHGGTLHLWGASERRLIAKHALYQITETLRWPDKDRDTIRREYSQALVGRPWIGDTSKSWTFQHTPDDWWTPYFPLLHHLHVDAEPWQEAEVKRLVAEHGAARFAGLDLFGVA
jgi:hypothetical protein